MKSLLVALLLAASLSVATGTVASAAAREPDDTAQAARQAMQQHDWPRAIAVWQQLYIKGDHDAPGQLCGLYFDGRPGKFETARVTDWCRRAAAGGDGWSLYRMGLLYLVGLGVGRNIDQAQALCVAAGRNAAGVPQGFCLAAANKQQQQAAQEALLPVPAAPDAATGQVESGATPEVNCNRLFTATQFSPAATVRWCGKAAADGNAEAFYRLGLMKLLGVGGPRDLAAAKADCAHADASAQPHTSTAFCLAAIAQLTRATSELAVSRDMGTVDADPTTGLPLPKTAPDPYAADRVLDAPHTTPTGLAYTCRQVSESALYEMPGLSILTPSDALFGRRIIDYRPADFSALDHAAATCAQATATVDQDGSLAKNFATFRQSLPALRVRQAALLADRRRAAAEAARIREVNQAYRSGPVAGLSVRTPQENACIEQVRRAWQASAGNAPNRGLEIRDSQRDAESGHFLAYGIANVVATDADQRRVIATSMFTCTFADDSNRIAKLQLLPGFSPRHR